MPLLYRDQLSFPQIEEKGRGTRTNAAIQNRLPPSSVFSEKEDGGRGEGTMDFRGIVDQMFAVEGGDAKKERWLAVQRRCAHNKHSLPSVLEKAAEQGRQPPPLPPWLSEGGREERRWISRPREKERGTEEKEGERRLCKQMAFSSPSLRFLSGTTYGQKEGEMGGIEKKGKRFPRTFIRGQ